MAKGRRAPEAAPQESAEPKERRHHPGIWLATLSTVVGVATGMFTLRDQVFPRESGSAQAVSASAFQQQVGGVCDDLNTDDRRRARQVKTIHRRLRTARTTISQRNALLDGQRQTIARSGDALAAFAAIETPKNLRATRRGVKAAWTRNLGRLQSYAERLDRVETRADLAAAIRYLSSLRTPVARDGVALMAGLRRLGGANCDLRTPINTKTFPLPPLKTTRASSASSKTSGTTATSSGASASGSGSGSAEPAGGESTGTPGTIVGESPKGGDGTTGATDDTASPSGSGSTGTPGDTGGGGGPPEGGGGGGG
jgi:hypothetical protein